MEIYPKRLSVVTLVLLLLAGSALAEDHWTTGRVPAKTIAYGDRLSQVEAELASLKSAIADECESDCVDDCWDPCIPSRSGLYGGAAVVFARPSFTDAANYGTLETITDTAGAGSFSYDHEVTPRIWLGYVGPRGLGVRARYWQFDHAGAARSLIQPDAFNKFGADWIHPWGYLTVLTDGTGQTLNVTNSLEVHTADFEVTRALNFSCVEITFGGGLRYAFMRQTFNANVQNVYGVVEQTLTAHHNIEGVGPTVSMDLRCPIGPCCGLAFVGGARWSAIFGNSDFFGALDGGDPFDYSLDEVLSIGEIQIGLEWTRQVQDYGTFLVRAGYEAQLWFEAGSPSNVLGDLGFEGFSIGLGLSR